MEYNTLLAASQPWTVDINKSVLGTPRITMSGASRDPGPMPAGVPVAV